MFLLSQASTVQCPTCSPGSPAVPPVLRSAHPAVGPRAAANSRTCAEPRRARGSWHRGAASRTALPRCPERPVAAAPLRTPGFQRGMECGGGSGSAPAPAPPRRGAPGPPRAAPAPPPPPRPGRSRHAALGAAQRAAAAAGSAATR